MKTLILKDIVNNSGSNIEGATLFNYLQQAFLNREALLLQIDSDLSLSSSFLNSSIGEFLDNYGLSSFKQTVKFKGSKKQYLRLADYIQKYQELYLA